MTRDEAKKRIINEIDKHKEEIINIGTHIANTPELGFKETKTSQLVCEVFQNLGLPFTTGLGITGAKAMLTSSKPGPCLAILGELDAIICYDHPKSDPSTGAVHACGHNAQIAAMLGAAMGLVYADLKDSLSGSIAFVGVPAEEYVELEYRHQLRKQGKLRYLGGKPELIYAGAFDDVDMSIMMHARIAEGLKAGFVSSYNGCIVKLIRYTGRAAHAGACPQDGVNALNAAMIGLTAINSLRETFKDTDYVRVHPIITRGGDLVNVIPSDVRMETYVRGKSIEAIHSANAKVDQALIAGAMALGAKVHIQDMPGYLPMVADIGLRKVIEDNMDVLIDADSIKHLAHRPGSTDFGDVSHLMPVAEISIGGFSGCPHGANFEVSDPELAYVTSSKLLALTAVDLLWENADTANSIAKHYDPRFTIDKYLEYMDGLFSETIYGELRNS